MEANYDSEAISFLDKLKEKENDLAEQLFQIDHQHYNLFNTSLDVKHLDYKKFFFEKEHKIQEFQFQTLNFLSEREIKNKELQLKNKELELEEMKINNDAELRRIQLENDKAVKMFEIEKEKELKMFEIEKQKELKMFEIEKQKENELKMFENEKGSALKISGDNMNVENKTRKLPFL